jgi:hypothetical protein
VDLDGDKIAELVQTSDPSRPSGAVFRDATGPYWKVYRPRLGTVTPTVQRFALPESGTTEGFFATSCLDTTGGKRAWLLLDVNGDRKLDLAQTADPSKTGLAAFSDTTGPYWKVWLGR